MKAIIALRDPLNVYDQETSRVSFRSSDAEFTSLCDVFKVMEAKLASDWQSQSFVGAVGIVSVAIDSDNRDVSTGFWSTEELLGGMFRSCGPRCVPLGCGFSALPLKQVKSVLSSYF